MQTDHTENVVRRDVGGMVTAAVFILVAVIALWDTTTMVDADSFVFPRAVAIAMIIFCMLLITWDLVRPRSGNGDVSAPGASTIRRVSLVMAMLASTALMPWLGFLISGFAAFVSIMLIAMYDQWTPFRKLVYPLVCAAFVVGFYFLFAELLLVPLPVGSLFERTTIVQAFAPPRRQPVADIVISEFMDQAAVDSLAADFDVMYDPLLVDRHDDLLAAITSARALVVRNRTQVRGELLQASPALRVVGRLGVGLDNIDLAACTKRAVAVHPATGANDAAVAEYVIATAMILMRDAYAAGPQVIAGDWPRQRCMGREIGGKVLGLVGFGGIARETAQRARALGMSVMAHDPFVAETDPAWKDVERSELDTLLASADVVSLHLPLTDGTRGLLDARMIARMKKGAVLVNTARGGIVDEDAVVESLRAGHLAGAAIDVFGTEPVVAAAGARFAGVSNLVLTPHIAGVTQESNVRVSAVTAENVRKVLSKK